MLKNTLTYIKHKPSLTIGFMFSIGSLLLGTLVSALPAIKLRLGFTDGILGLSLLMAPLGSLTAVALSSRIFSRVWVGRMLMTGYLMQCVIYLFLINAPTAAVFRGALFMTGFVGSLNGISINSVVNHLEKQVGRKLMSTSHGMYSIGGGVSAGLAAISNSLHIKPGLQIVFVSSAIACTLVLIRKQLLAHKMFIHSGSKFAAPPASLSGLAFICFVTFMGEGCIADWSAIFLRESLHSTLSVSSLGYAGFSLMMALGRLNGDRLAPLVQPKKLVMGGSLIAAAGFLVVVTLPFQATAIAGFTLVGLGFSCVVPILFSAAANVPGMSPAMGLASIATGGLIGFLTGPALIGIISEKFSLSTGLSLVLILSLFSVVAAARNRYLKEHVTIQV